MKLQKYALVALNLVFVIFFAQISLAKVNQVQATKATKAKEARVRFITGKNESLNKYKIIRRYKPQKYVYDAQSQKVTRIPTGRKLEAQATLAQPKDLEKSGVGLALREKKPKNKRSVASTEN